MADEAVNVRLEVIDEEQTARAAKGACSAAADEQFYAVPAGEPASDGRELALEGDAERDVESSG